MEDNKVKSRSEAAKELEQSIHLVNRNGFLGFVQDQPTLTVIMSQMKTYEQIKFGVWMKGWINFKIVWLDLPNNAYIELF